MRKLIANLTENARLFAETRKLLGSGGKVLEVVEDEQEQAPETDSGVLSGRMVLRVLNQRRQVLPPVSLPPSAAADAAATVPSTVTLPRMAGTDLASRLPMGPPQPMPRHNNGNGSHGGSGFNRLRNEFLTAARRVATTKNQAIGEVVEWASGGAFKYGDIGRMTEADAPKLRAATELMATPLPVHNADREHLASSQARTVSRPTASRHWSLRCGAASGRQRPKAGVLPLLDAWRQRISQAFTSGLRALCYPPSSVGFARPYLAPSYRGQTGSTLTVM